MSRLCHVAIACPVTGELVVVLAGPSSAQGRGGPGAVDLSEQCCDAQTFEAATWNIMEYHGISWNIMEYHGISWNIMEYHGISWNILMLNILNILGISWNIPARLMSPMDAVFLGHGSQVLARLYRGIGFLLHSSEHRSPLQNRSAVCQKSGQGPTGLGHQKKQNMAKHLRPYLYKPSKRWPGETLRFAAGAYVGPRPTFKIPSPMSHKCHTRECIISGVAVASCCFHVP